jgi:resuscitation-promoting factor RpfB
LFIRTVNALMMIRGYRSLSIRQTAAWFSLLFFMLLLAGCAPAAATPQGNFRVSIAVDGDQKTLEVVPGTTAQAALDQAGVTLNSLDRVDPPSYSMLENGAQISVVRVREVFSVQESVVPFERQTVRNENLPEGQTLLVQPGVTGTRQVTYRQLFENEQETSNVIFKTETITEPMAEIVMVGVQKPFTPIPIPGRLVYLSGSNAWAMEGTTGNRRPLVTSGDLDGFIFSLSPKGDWLLYTRREPPAAGAASSDRAADINSLWAINVTDESAKPVNLRVKNIKHFAAFVPGRGLTVLYSTVEPRSTAPGWQANNDLQLIQFSSGGVLLKQEEVLPANAGGVYGWWGTSFAFSPDGKLLAYARPDGVGLVDRTKGQLLPLADILPFQTGSDWAWVSGLGFAPNARALYFSTHATKAGLESQEASPLFDLSALPIYGGPQDDGSLSAETLDAGPLIHLAPEAGMFAYPVPSPMMENKSFLVAYLHAIIPEQSDSKRYRLVVMDRDGSNRNTVFPPEDYQGLEPQRVVWSPQPFQNGDYWLAINYQGNLWLVDAQTGQVQQVTGDGLITRFGIDWK